MAPGWSTKEIVVVPEVREVPRFALMERGRVRPVAVVLAMVTAAVIFPVVVKVGRAHRRHYSAANGDADRSAGAATGSGAAANDDDDDPSQIDTVVLGDAADAPVPAKKGNHVSPVHATIVIRLPRFGDQVGLIPDSEAGHLLYGWLAAFNQASEPMMEQVLPNAGAERAAALQMELRRATGGYSLLSAKEVQPGLMVFRMRDQTPAGNEVLGTLQACGDCVPPRIASFSLRDVGAEGEAVAR